MNAFIASDHCRPRQRELDQRPERSLPQVAGPLCPLEITVIPEERYGKGCDISKALTTEAKSIESRLKGGYLYILDSEGKSYDTKAFAAELIRQQNSGISRLEFVIGGPYGLDQSFKDKKKESRASALSLSAMTMSHQIIRLVLLEQLYRALNINAGGSYHK